MIANITKIRLQTDENDRTELVLTLTQECSYQVRRWLPEAKKLIEDGKLLTADIGMQKKKRSLNANAYSYLLSDKMADVLMADKDDVHFEMLRRYGQKSVISVLKEALPMLKSSIKYTDEIGESETNGKIFTHLKVYKGSHDFNTAEMSIYIAGIVSECKLLDIETMTPDEIARLKSSWGKEK